MESEPERHALQLRMLGKVCMSLGGLALLLTALSLALCPAAPSHGGAHGMLPPIGVADIALVLFLAPGLFLFAVGSLCQVRGRVGGVAAFVGGSTLLLGFALVDSVGELPDVWKVVALVGAFVPWPVAMSGAYMAGLGVTVMFPMRSHALGRPAPLWFAAILLAVAVVVHHSLA